MYIYTSSWVVHTEKRNTINIPVITDRQVAELVLSAICPTQLGMWFAMLELDE